jgi:hypothetical protein
MFGFKIKNFLIFLSIFLVLYGVFLLISALILFKYGYLTKGEKIYSEIVHIVINYPINALWNDGRWPLVTVLLNGCFWGFICYSTILTIKKLTRKT